MEFTLLWAALTAIAFGWVGLRIWNERLPAGAGDRLLTASLIGLAVGRLVAMIGQNVNPFRHLTEFIVVRGGVNTAAATIAFIATLVWSTRRVSGAVDAMAPAILLGLSGWHTGCLWRGACLGTPSDLPWTWAQDASTVSRHPVELYAALGLMVGAFVVSQLGWRPWLRSGAALGLAAVVRLVTEPWRPSLGSGPIGWYVAGLVIGLLIIAAGPLLVPARSSAPT